MVENDFEANEQRRPRAPRQESDDEAVNSNVGDPVNDNMDNPPDLEEDKDKTNDEDKEIVIRHTLHMRPKWQGCVQRIPEIQETTR